jgi:threonine efflux protein
LSSLGALALLYLAALLVPGPNLLLLTHTAAASSRRAALGVALGIAIGAFIWVTVAVFGVHKIFETAPALQTVLRIIGGLYLLYLAQGLLRSVSTDRATAKQNDVKSDSDLIVRSRGSPFTYVRRGLLTNLTNPKSLAFWTSVAIVSLDPNAPLATRIAAVLMVGSMGLVWHIALAYVFSTAPAQRAYLRAKPVLSLVTGVVMGVFGLRLLWALQG